MAEGDSGKQGVVDTLCNKLEDAFKKQADQETGDEDTTPFLDTISVTRNKDTTIEDITEELFDTSDLNAAWRSAYDDGTKEGAEMRNRLGVAYLCAWKKAFLKFYSGNVDVQAVYGLGLVHINIGAQSVEATRLVLSEPPSDENAQK